MISLILFCLAAICNSVQDTVDHHYYKFRWKDKWNPMWWNASVSWKNKYVDRDVSKGFKKWNILGIVINKPVQITDAWHFFKTLMIILLAFSVVFYVPIVTFFEYKLLNILLDVLLLGIVWNNTFSLFYDKILVTKK